MARSQSIFSPNPAMKKGFEIVDRDRTTLGASDDRMTLNGTISITAFLLGALLLTGVIGWVTSNVIVAVICGVSAFVLGLVTSFKPKLAPRTALIYALLQGYLLGFISQTYDARYDGIVVQALGLTVGIAAALLALYRTGLINPSANFKLAVAAATGGIFLFYLVSIGLSFVGVNVSIIDSSNNLGILFSVFVVVLASANLVIDFDFIEDGVRNGAPKYMEWYGAFGVMVTLIWLYLELLRLLSKLQRR